MRLLNLWHNVRIVVYKYLFLKLENISRSAIIVGAFLCCSEFIDLMTLYVLKLKSKLTKQHAIL